MQSNSCFIIRSHDLAHAIITWMGSKLSILMVASIGPTAKCS